MGLKNSASLYRCANPDFETYINGKGFKTAQGSFSDISLVAPELNIAAVNLSAGYYNAHTRHEFINRAHLHNTIQKAIGIVEESTRHDFPKFEYIETFCPIISDSSIPHFHNLLEHNSIPHNLPSDLQDIYEALLDFYSANELEAFCHEYGNHILRQIFNEEVATFYHQ